MRPLGLYSLPSDRISAFQSKSLTVIDPLEGEQLLTSELNELLNISLTFWRAGQEVLNNWSDPEFKKVCPGQSQEVFFWGLKDSRTESFTYIKDSDALHDLLVCIFLRHGPVHLDGLTPQLEVSC